MQYPTKPSTNGMYGVAVNAQLSYLSVSSHCTTFCAVTANLFHLFVSQSLLFYQKYLIPQLLLLLHLSRMLHHAVSCAPQVARACSSKDCSGFWVIGSRDWVQEEH